MNRGSTLLRPNFNSGLAEGLSMVDHYFPNGDDACGKKISPPRCSHLLPLGIVPFNSLNATGRKERALHFAVKSMHCSKHGVKVHTLAEVGVPGLVNFITAVAYHFCLARPRAFTQPGTYLLAEPCTFLALLNGKGF